MSLNASALAAVPDLPSTTVAGARVIDATHSGIAGGLALARVCLAGLADVQLVVGDPFPLVQVRTDSPVPACLASQYAGWQVKVDKYFAMGSGPMRAAYGKEKLFDTVPGRETPDAAVGVLETKKPPTPEVIAYLAERVKLPAEKLTLLFAPAASLAGAIQVVARSVETALHKLHELHFDLSCVRAGFGTAPLPPVGKDEMQAIGRTNDAILYGGRMTLWVETTDDIIDAVGPQVPSNASKDYGAPFAELFARYGDFYKIDPLLFSPAEVTFVNLLTGRARTFGRTDAGLVATSFGGA